MHKAFTMIELIFVIVIIGIISSIAVPKLVATRDDAKIVKLLADIDTLLKDINNAYTAQGISALASTNIGDITNVYMTISATICNDYRPSVIWAGKTNYLCVDDVHVLKIGTTGPNDDPQYIELSQIGENTNSIVTQLNSNIKFQKLTNGRSGKKYYLNQKNVIY